jgi:predicted kinase
VREKLSKKPILVIVSGLPGAGKSTLSQRLADHFQLPLIQKDTIKETLCDLLECTTLPQSQLYGRVSMALLYQFAEVMLKRGCSCIIESTFHPSFSMPDLLQLKQHCPFLPLQIYCWAEVAVLAERVKRRWESGQRHRGHMEHLRVFDPTYPIPPDYLQPLPLDGHIIEVNTTNFETIDYQHLFTQIRLVLRD